MDVLSLLKQDHKTVGDMIDAVQECEPGDRRLSELAAQISAALTVHAAIEEKFFYPLLRQRAEESEQRVDVFEAFTEHDVVKHLIALLKSGGRKPAEEFKAEVQVLGENVKHHVKEEESTIFTLARDVMDTDELEQLGERMEKAKTRMMTASGRATAGRGRKSARKTTAARKTGGRKAAKKSTGRKTAGRKSSGRTRR